MAGESKRAIDLVFKRTVLLTQWGTFVPHLHGANERLSRHPTLQQAVLTSSVQQLHFVK